MHIIDFYLPLFKYIREGGVLEVGIKYECSI